MRTNSGQARNTITHALIATLTLTCMLCAQCMAILEDKWVFTTQGPASKQKEKQARNSFLLKTEDKLRPGQEHNHTTHDTCAATLTLTCMLCAQCMAILEAKWVFTTQSPASKQKEKQARNSFLLKTEDKIRPGQLGTDKLYATLTLTCMHALCMATPGRTCSHPAKSCKQSSCTC